MPPCLTLGDALYSKVYLQELEERTGLDPQRPQRSSATRLPYQVALHRFQMLGTLAKGTPFSNRYDWHQADVRQEKDFEDGKRVRFLAAIEEILGRYERTSKMKCISEMEWSWIVQEAKEAALDFLPSHLSSQLFCPTHERGPAMRHALESIVVEAGRMRRKVLRDFGFVDNLGTFQGMCEVLFCSGYDMGP